MATDVGELITGHTSSTRQRPEKAADDVFSGASTRKLVPTGGLADHASAGRRGRLMPELGRWGSRPKRDGRRWQGRSCRQTAGNGQHTDFVRPLVKKTS
jgi:hypothetical protein